MDVRRDLQDDPSIPDDELLYRSIHPDQLGGSSEVRSSAFKSRTNPHISVDLGSVSTPEQTRERWPAHAGVAKLITRTVRSLTPGVARAPIEGNPAHALIIYDVNNISRSAWAKVARKLAKACVWAIPPVSHAGRSQ